jgi:hypothetical protein
VSVFHKFEWKGRTYTLIDDEGYQTRGSYAYDTPEETKKAEDDEIAALDSGELVALGCIVTEPCEGPHCKACSGVVEVESLWGIVIEPETTAIEAHVKWTFGV